jgi:hypothetical protein
MRRRESSPQDGRAVARAEAQAPARAASWPRLVRDERPRPDPRALRVYRQAAAQETVLARETARDPSFAPGDPRWRFATEVSAALQGATLAFEDRRRLLALAERIGIRAFDANLIVALVQDRARRGEPVESAAGTLAMLPAGRPAGRHLGHVLAAGLVAAMLFDAVLIAWLILG